MTETKKAIELQPGDEIVSEGTFPESLFTGMVRVAVVTDYGVRINLTDGGCYLRPPDHPFAVKA